MDKGADITIITGAPVMFQSSSALTAEVLEDASWLTLHSGGVAVKAWR